MKYITELECLYLSILLSSLSIPHFLFKVFCHPFHMIKYLRNQRHQSPTSLMPPHNDSYRIWRLLLLKHGRSNVMRSCESSVIPMCLLKYHWELTRQRCLMIHVSSDWAVSTSILEQIANWYRSSVRISLVAYTVYGSEWYQFDIGWIGLLSDGSSWADLLEDGWLGSEEDEGMSLGWFV